MISIIDFIYRVAKKSVYQKKLNKIIKSSIERADFLINDRGICKVSIYSEMIRKTPY